MRLALKRSISDLLGFTFKKALFSAFLGFNAFKIIYKLYFQFQWVKLSFLVGYGTRPFDPKWLFSYFELWIIYRQKPQYIFCGLAFACVLMFFTLAKTGIITTNLQRCPTVQIYKKPSCESLHLACHKYC